MRPGIEAVVVAGDQRIDGVGADEEPELRIDFLRRAVCDLPVVRTVFAGSSRSLRQIRWN